MTPEDLKNRTKTWAVSVVLFTRKFPFEDDFKAVKRQIVRSAPSAAANYRAACRRKSGKDFLNKLKIVEEELDETMFWLEFVEELTSKFHSEIIPLHKEANELLSITVASIKTTRKSLNNNGGQST